MKTTNLKDITREEAYNLSKHVGKAWDEFHARLQKREEDKLKLMSMRQESNTLPS